MVEDLLSKHKAKADNFPNFGFKPNANKESDDINERERVGLPY